MPKQFYKFDKVPFRDELIEFFIDPAANWFLGKKRSSFILPQISGSNWECALAIKSLFELLDIDNNIDESLRDNIERKTFNTVRWMLSQIKWDKKGGTCHWDGVVWDTAVCSHVLFLSEKRFKLQWEEEELEKIKLVRIGAVKWLIKNTLYWVHDVRYATGPDDLAQMLNTLIYVSKHYPNDLTFAEEQIVPEDDGGSIAKIVKVLLSTVEHTTEELSDGTENLSYWADCFNTSQVADALSGYIIFEDSTKKDVDLINKVESVLYKSIRYIEVNQIDGKWDGMADTCGILHGYLRVTSSLKNVEPLDRVVFQALRWMCDEKQAFSDGSFLHTSYVTVFYLMALLEAYQKWPLGKKTTLEVYDYALWSAPLQITIERSRSLELQLELKEKIAEANKINEKHYQISRLLTFFTLLIVQLILLVIILSAANIIDIDWQSFDFNIADTRDFWTGVGLGLSIITFLTSTLMGIYKKSKKLIVSKLV